MTLKKEIDIIPEICDSMYENNELGSNHEKPNIVDSGPIHVTSVYTSQVPNGNIPVRSE